VIEQAHVLGFDGIELRFIENSDRLWELPALHGTGSRRLTIGWLQRAGYSLRGYKLLLPLRGGEPAPAIAGDGPADGRTSRYAQCAGDRIFGDRVQPGTDLTSTAAWVAEGIHQLAEFARPSGVEIWLESHGNFAPAAATLGVLRGPIVEIVA